MKYLSIVALFAASIICAPASHAAPGKKPVAAPLTDCDRLSGMPPTQGYTTYDMPGLRYREGKTTAEMDVLIAACRDAAKLYPDEARFPFRLGMALRDRGASEEAMAAFAAARAHDSLGGYDEAAMLYFFGNRNDPKGFERDGKVGIALLDEGLSKTDAPILRASKGLGLLTGPQDVRDIPAGVAILRELVKKNDILATVILADFLSYSKDPAEEKEGVALYWKAEKLGSGYAARELAMIMWNDKRDMAIKLLEKAVDRGNLKALDDLGFAYERGRGVPQNFAKALALYERGAMRGYAKAQYHYAMLYRMGDGVPRDYAKARHWLELAVAQGNAVAMFDLGMMYDHAVGVPQDLAKARALYERAAALGQTQAMNNMGYLFENGRAAEVDYDKAREWYEKALAKGDSSAASNLAGLYQSGKGVKRDYVKAFELLQQSAADKNAKGTNNLAVAYLKGRGVKADPVKAREIFRQAIDYGSVEAVHNLASMYEDGSGGARNNDEARALFKRSAESGIANGMYRYAMRLYYDEAGAEFHSNIRDYHLREAYKKAKKNGNEAVFADIRQWLTKAVAGGDTHGLEMLAVMVADGYGGEKDPKEALTLYERVAENSTSLKYEFARRLRKGDGVEADPARARRVFMELMTGSWGDLASRHLVEMLDGGEGGPKDPEQATLLLRQQVEQGREGFYRPLAERLIKGLGTPADPAQARLLLAVGAFQGDRKALGLLGKLYEDGEGGAADIKDAVTFYRIGHRRKDPFAASRLAVLLRTGRGTAPDAAKAREILDSIPAYELTDPDAQLVYMEMLDKGEGGAPDPKRAAGFLLYAAFGSHDLRAIALLRNPGDAMTPATRSAVIENLQRRKLKIPAEDGTSAALIDEETEAKLKAGL